MATDRLIFLREGKPWIEALWKGPWPPPKRLVYMEGRSGYEAIVEEETAPADALAAARALGTITETRFRLRNCSQIEEAAPEGAHWFRGAEYVIETDDA